MATNNYTEEEEKYNEEEIIENSEIDDNNKEENYEEENYEENEDENIIANDIYFKNLKNILASGNIVCPIKYNDQNINLYIIKYDDLYYVNITNLVTGSVDGIGRILRAKKYKDMLENNDYCIVNKNLKIIDRIPSCFTTSSGSWLNIIFFSDICNFLSPVTFIKNLYTFSFHFVKNIDIIYNKFNRSNPYCLYIRDSFIRKNCDGYISITDTLNIFKTTKTHTIAKFRNLLDVKKYIDKYPKSIICYIDNVSKKCTFLYYKLAIILLKWLNIVNEEYDILYSYFNEKVENQLTIEENPTCLLICDKHPTNTSKYDEQLKKYNRYIINLEEQDVLLKPREQKKAEYRAIKNESIKNATTLNQEIEEKKESDNEPEIIETTKDIENSEEIENGYINISECNLFKNIKYDINIEEELENIRNNTDKLIKVTKIIERKQIRIYGTSDNPLFMLADLLPLTSYQRVESLLRLTNKHHKMPWTKISDLYTNQNIFGQTTLISLRGILDILSGKYESSKLMQYIVAHYNIPYLYVKRLHKEQEYVSYITECFNNICEINTQYFVGKYKVDIMLKCLNNFPIFIEIDEVGHNDRDKDMENIRENYILDNVLCCIIRFNPDKASFSTSLLLNKILEVFTKNMTCNKLPEKSYVIKLY